MGICICSSYDRTRTEFDGCFSRRANPNPLPLSRSRKFSLGVENSGSHPERSALGAPNAQCASGASVAEGPAFIPSSCPERRSRSSRSRRPSDCFSRRTNPNPLSLFRSRKFSLGAENSGSHPERSALGAPNAQCAYGVSVAEGPAFIPSSCPERRSRSDRSRMGICGCFFACRADKPAHSVRITGDPPGTARIRVTDEKPTLPDKLKLAITSEVARSMVDRTCA
jgi:hypothetical protein